MRACFALPGNGNFQNSGPLSTENNEGPAR